MKPLLCSPFNLAAALARQIPGTNNQLSRDKRRDLERAEARRPLARRNVIMSIAARSLARRCRCRRHGKYRVNNDILYICT